MGHLKGLIGGLGFMSTFPLGRDKESFKAFRTHGYLFVIIGFILGGLIGSICASFYLFPPSIAGAFYVMIVYAITGINHVDGLADFADGLMAFGNSDQKRRAMKDTLTGAGGILFLMLTLLLNYCAAMALFSMKPPLITMIAIFMSAEVFAKQGMLTVIVFGKSSHRGMGSKFVEKNSTWDFLIGLGITIVVTTWSGLPGLASLLFSLGVAIAILFVAKRSFGGVGGDTMGAANEITKAFGLSCIVLIYSIIT